MNTVSFGYIGMAYTSPAHRRRGFSSLCISALARKSLSVGLPVVCHVEAGNGASRAMLEKIGFRCAGEAEWVIYEPCKN